MAMNGHNRQNPFMYLLESKDDEMKSKSTNAVKSFVVMSAIEIELVVLFIIFCFITHTFNIFMVIGLILPYVVLCIQTINLIKITDAESSYVNDIIFSDKYKFIDLNNEKLLSKINKYNINIGKAEIVIESNKFFIIIQLIYNGCFIIYFMILLCKYFL